MMKQMRLFDHVTLKVTNIERSKVFYRAVVETLGHTISNESPRDFFINELYVTETKEPSKNVHLAFSASNPGAVKIFHETALRAGGTSKREPFENSSKGYYETLVMDPDGNVIEAVYKWVRPIKIR